MKRLARSAGLLLALSLLASAATGHAECAWVLWQNVIRDAGFSTEVVPQTAGISAVRA